MATRPLDPADPFVFDSDDLAAVEQMFVDQYGRTRLEAPDSGRIRTRLQRRRMSALYLDDFAVSYGLRYHADPRGKVTIMRVHEGVFRAWGRAGVDDYGPGEVWSMGFPDRPLIGELREARSELTMFDPALFDRVAATAPGEDGRPVRLTGHRPRTERAGRHLTTTLEYVRHLAEADFGGLVASTAVHHLVATILDTFPSTAMLEPTTVDRHDSTPALLRRATTYVDDNAHTDLALADVAGAVYITPRALQYMLRYHLICTPMEYVRRVRMSHAHHELLAADRETTTVAAVAARWGFAHSGRFAAAYRRRYGQSPHVTVRSGC